MSILAGFVVWKLIGLGSSALVLGGGFALLPGAGLVAKLATARGFFSRMIPPKAWIAIAIVLVVVAGVLWHRHQASAALKAAEARGAARSDARHKKAIEDITAKALAIRRKTEALSASITKQERDKYEADARRIGANANALRVSGPGRATCAVVGGDPGLSGGAGGRVASSGGGSAPSTRVRYPDGLLLAVPYQWAVNTAEQCDLNRAEALRWREHDRLQREAWEALRGARR